MSNKINSAYIFTSGELEIISSHFSNHNDWSKGVFDNIKSNIKEHLRIQQNNKCCYCKYPLGFDIKAVDIEHIIPKSEYSKFTFEPLNLALSCPGCNTIKSTKKVLTKRVVLHPKRSDNYQIVHAHYDDYSQHIDIYEKCVFSAKSEKGSITITHCGLYRYGSVEERAKLYNKKTSLIDELVNELKKANKDQKEQFVNTILNIIK